MRTCKRCGRELPEDNFRTYYGGRKGTYSFCKQCESIEQRRKYLVRKDSESPDGLTVEEAAELDKINELYDRRAAAGLAVPKTRPMGGAVTRLVDEMLEALPPKSDE